MIGFTLAGPGSSTFTRMHERPWGVVALLVVLLAVVAGGAPVAAQNAPPDPAGPAPAAVTAPGPSQPPKAWLLVDADTGAVLNGANQHDLRSPASTIKLLTALIAAQRLPANDPVPISALAESKPARKINVKAGQVWDLEDLLHSMLLVSANDAAYAVAERVGRGSLDEWVAVAEATATRLGAVDHPALNDPAGLDDTTFSNKGGDRISAYDMAIVARAVLDDPALMGIIQTPHYEFVGGDLVAHTLNNHDTFLRLYEGATGMKTGTTDLAGRCLVASATRDGRTMLVVEYDAPNIYVSAGELLDQGFATPVAAEQGLAHLPDLVPDAAIDLPAVAVAPPASAETGVQETTGAGGGVDLNSAPIAAVVFAVGCAPLLVLLRRRSVLRAGAAARPVPVDDVAYDDRREVGVG